MMKNTENQMRTRYSTGGGDILIDTWGCYCSAFGLNVILSERQPRVKHYTHMKTGNKTENNKLLLWPLVNWLNLKVNVNITSSCVLWVWWLSIWSCWQWESTQRLAAYDVTGGLSWMMWSCSWLTFPRAADPSSHRMRITQKSALERSVQTYILHVCTCTWTQ